MLLSPFIPPSPFPLSPCVHKSVLCVFIYNTICQIESQWEFAVWLSELKSGLCDNQEEWDGWEVGGRLWWLWPWIQKGAQTQVFPFCCFPLFLCIDHWGRLSYLFLLFFGTLHSDAYIFPFLLCFSLPFYSQLCVRRPQTAILLFCISFSWGWSWFLSPVKCHEPLSVVHRALYQI